MTAATELISSMLRLACLMTSAWLRHLGSCPAVTGRAAGV